MRLSRGNDKKSKARGVGGFMSGVLVLSLSTVAVKLIGLAVKIPLLSTLGAVGMGYFNSAYEIYAMLCVISTAGLPVALSMLVSADRERGDMRGAHQAYRWALGLFLLMGAAGSGAMLIFSRQIAELVGNGEARLCIIAIAPALLLVCFSSTVRGYFQGLGDMTPTAVSQLIEAVGKLLFGVGFGAWAVFAGATLPQAAAMSVLGLTLGIFISSLYLLIKKLSEKGERVWRGDKTSAWDAGVLRTLIKIAAPITLSSAALSSCRIIDMALILRRLQEAGLGAVEANEIYGSYTTLAVPVFSLAPSLITPISLSLVPRLSAAIEANDGDGEAEVADRALRLTALLSIPASMGIVLYAKPILSLLFSGQGEAVEIAAPLLAVLGASVLFSGMITVTNAVLQARRQTVKPIISMAIGSAVKLISAYILIGIPDIGVYGAPVSTLICNVTVSAINLWFVGRGTPKSSENSGFCKIFILPSVASALAVGISFAVYIGALHAGGSVALSFLAAFCVAVAAYIPLAFIFGALGRSDLAELPFGARLLGIYDGIFNKINIKITKEKDRKK